MIDDLDPREMWAYSKLVYPLSIAEENTLYWAAEKLGLKGAGLCAVSAEREAAYTAFTGRI